MNVDLYERYGLRRVLNAAGTMTYLGSSSVGPRVAAAMNAALPAFVEMRELQAAASRVIAEATGAEAGCVTASAASGIAIAVAASMTGTDLDRIERLPDVAGLRHEVILQKGHSVSFGASLAQTIRLTGASLVEVGAATACAGYQLRGAIGPNTAAIVYVVSHHAVQSGMLGLAECCAIAAERGVPVIVDAASEYDLEGFLAAGARLVVYSGHKFLGGPTSGIVAGELGLVRACYMQEKGIGRCMKVGKESIVGVLEALAQWRDRDAAAIRRAEESRIDYAYEALNRLEGLVADRVVDPTGNPITRLRVTVDAGRCGLSAESLVLRLAAGNPSIQLRAHESALGHFQIDACQLRDGEIERVCEAIAGALLDPAPPPSGSPGDRTYASLLRWPD
ncbi:SelA-like pyridoxal phosphate-dependent enzyme [Cohnella sp. REN36]|uniref:SelA-like pyridoxal phosphate-dependent enzyme n=1 Tax=Cohnella sp. REN36 TaxID=2887347 RepID=UPI001D1401BB|nr:SelA-like pyridoxal phosphate-dependent enzyme [Cohnella sp. REN36]MCC3376717.1 SelA-like pyridoxal phosphate-dependent enzyme [Cohnella sp. REN36]